MWNENDKDRLGLGAWGSLKAHIFNERSLELHIRQIFRHGFDKRNEYCSLLT